MIMLLKDNSPGQNSFQYRVEPLSQDILVMSNWLLFTVKIDKLVKISNQYLTVC